jgi:hypothetical protein
MKMETKDAVNKISKELKTDLGYYFSWQSNIAMSFLDELSRAGYKLPNQHEIANNAAKNFLNLLIGTDITNENEYFTLSTDQDSYVGVCKRENEDGQ